MQEIRYKLWAWGPPTGDGSNQQFNIGIRAKAKRSPTNQFEIANELLCMRLGLALKLPIPAGVLIEKDSALYFASLHVAVTGERLPPCTRESLDIVAMQHQLACGILLFDSWIINEDRSPKNISYDDQTGKVYIFDHGRAFYDGKGRSYLESMQDNIGIGNHCLAPRITSLGYFDDWPEKILAIPDYFVAESMEQAATVGLPNDEVAYCTKFLLERRLMLKDLFAHFAGDMFPKRDDGLLDPFRAPPDPIEYFI